MTEKITSREKARFGIPDRDLLETAFRAQRPQLVVTGAWMFEVHSALTGPQLNRLVASFREEYSLVARTGEVRVYLRNKDFPPPRPTSP